jgi:deoxyribodipyrimidine photolyase-related protein
MKTRKLPQTHLLRLVLGDQLDASHSWFSRRDEQVLYVMMEVRTETDYVVHHIQKILAVFGGMRRFAAARSAEGHRFRYISLDAPENRQSFGKNLVQLLTETGADRVELQQPDEYRLALELAPERLGRELSEGVGRRVAVTRVPAEHFLVSLSETELFLPQQRKPVMEFFYRRVRAREGWLMEAPGKAGDHQPAGGRWNYDAENRSGWKGPPRDPEAPAPFHSHNDLSEEYATVLRGGCRFFGEVMLDDLRWPVTREQALLALDHFLEYGLPRFGTYQDAMHTTEAFLFHSLLSFPLNVKLISPREVIAAVLEVYDKTGSGGGGGGGISDARLQLLPQVEGFIRQIAGWREYMRLLYWRMMPGLSSANALAADRPLPQWYWTGETGMACLAAVIRQSLSEAYAHHIQRLMITGNFALIAGVRPEEVDAWYLGIYIDAFEWVELPNTRGMSQYADGGQIATKPYAASAAYISRQSNYCRSCRYDPRTRSNPDSCPFNALYWDFYDRNRSLAANHRVQFVYPALAKLSAEEHNAMTVRARWLRDHLSEL